MQVWKRRRFDGDTRDKRLKKELPKDILPVFEPSGLLELESNNKEGILLKHVEPSDAKSPIDFYVEHKVPLKERNIFQAVLYKNGEQSPVSEYHLESKSSYIIGRVLGRSLNEEQEKETVVADIAIPEETCSKQHCAIQFREVGGQLLAYVIDLDSSNGTYLNGVRLPAARYVELRSGDLINPCSDEDEEASFEVVFMKV